MTPESHLKPLITDQQIAQKISEIAKVLTNFYRDKDLVIIMVLKGAVCLVADLIRSLDVPCDIEAVQCSSYGARGAERGDLQVFGLEHLQIENRDVLLVDDIFDSGVTLSTLIEKLKEEKPRSLKSLVLLTKKVPRKTKYLPDYSLFEIENRFVVGYGLDFKERYRGLSGVFAMD